MATAGHILFGNHDVIHINGSAPITNFYPDQVNHVGSLDLAVEPHLKQHPCNQWDVARQGEHEQLNHPPPHGGVTGDQVAIQGCSSQGQA